MPKSRSCWLDGLILGEDMIFKEGITYTINYYKFNMKLIVEGDSGCGRNFMKGWEDAMEYHKDFKLKGE